MDELISKKEVLKLTGISYGQLYRWKRQRLIPESWFMKQSTFTGQETFFPRERILKRIAMIHQLKDQYTLEEMAQLFAPEMSNRSFTIQDLAQIFDPVSELYTTYFARTEQKSVCFMEIVLIEAIQKLIEAEPVEEATKHRFLQNVQHWVSELEEKKNYRLFYCSMDSNERYLFLIEQPAQVFMDVSLQVIQLIHLEDFAKQIYIHMKSRLEE